VVTIAYAKLVKYYVVYECVIVTISRDKCDIALYPSVLDNAQSTSGILFSIRLRWNNRNISSIVVNIANAKLGKICIEYMNTTSVTISR